TAALHVAERALAIDGLAHRVDDATEEAVADGDREDLTGRLDRLTLLDVVDLAEDHGADRVLVEVQRQAQGARLELEDLVDRRVGKARHAGDAVADLDDAADLADRHVGTEVVEVLADRRGDVGDVDG